MNKNRILSIILVLMLTVSLAACGNDQSDSEGTNKLTVATDKGKVEGFTEDGVNKYLGVPFAKPPVDELRFAPPEDMEPWDDVLACKEKKPSALQEASSESSESSDENAEYSEDCLYLNIWAPEDATAEDDLPVLVFIHGGAFAFGSPNLEKYDGTRFASDGVIQVNLAYRLNGLGFAGFDEIQDEYGYVGNMGLLDQIKGLEWVAENISLFGGDPDNVTVCGESAGSMSISNLLISSEAKGLFDKAIMQSGTVLAQSVTSPNANGEIDKTKAATKKLMKSLGANNIEDMRKVDADDIVKNSVFSIDMTEQTDQYFFPTFDGVLIPEDPYEAITDGYIHEVDILTGFNTDEGSLFIPDGQTEEDYEAFIKLGFGEDAEAVMAKYPVDSENTATDRLRQLVKIFFAVGSQVYADSSTEKGNNVYMYEYAYTTPELKEQGLGAHHGMELEFVFDTLSDHLKDDTSEAVKDDIHNRWLNFIVGGDPNKGESVDVDWPLYNSNDKEIMKLDAEPAVEESPVTEDLEFMKSIIWDK